MIDLLYFYYIQSSLEQKVEPNFYVNRGFAFNIFLNIATCSLFLEKAFQVKFFYQSNWIFSFLISIIATYFLSKNKSKIYNKYLSKGCNSKLRIIKKVPNFILTDN